MISTLLNLMIPSLSSSVITKMIYHSVQQIVYLTVKLVLIGSSNAQEVIENLDYSFNDDAIVSSEISGYYDD